MSNKEMNLYDCASLFAETMNEKFPNGDGDSAILLVTTDGKKLSSLIEGKEHLVQKMLVHLFITDKELMSMVGEGLLTALEYEEK